VRLLVLGFTGGVVATGTMTTFRMPISRALPPTENFWAKYIGSEELEEYHLPAMILHALYGAVAGSIFAVSFPEIDDHSPAGTETTGLVGGILYSVPFTALGEVVLLNRMLEMDLDSNESMIFHAGHLVYGISLGAWVGSRYDTLTNEDDFG
jgi:hypothetical protein